VGEEEKALIYLYIHPRQDGTVRPSRGSRIPRAALCCRPLASR